MKRKIVFFFRKPNIDFSIERVFNTIIKQNVLKSDSEIINVDYHRIYPWNLLRNCIKVYRNRGKVNHIVGDIHYANIFLKKENNILTIHDLILLHRHSGVKRLFFFFFWYLIPCYRAKYVVCISEATRQDLLKYVKCNPNKVLVINNPVSSEFVFTSKSFTRAFPTILHIGTRENKNLDRVIEALKGIKCHLRIIGKLTPAQEILLVDYKVDCSNVYNITNSRIVEEYISCDIVSFPSLFEGFGMPIIEGQAVGRCVLTSNLSPMSDIAGEGAIKVDPFSVASIRGAFLQIINDEILRERLITDGLKNVKRFSAKYIAEQYSMLYDQILSGEK